MTDKFKDFQLAAIGFAHDLFIPQKVRSVAGCLLSYLDELEGRISKLEKSTKEIKDHGEL